VLHEGQAWPLRTLCIRPFFLFGMRISAVTILIVVEPLSIFPPYANWPVRRALPTIYRVVFHSGG
jgi:hypothetical protein